MSGIFGVRVFALEIIGVIAECVCLRVVVVGVVQALMIVGEVVSALSAAVVECVCLWVVVAGVVCALEIVGEGESAIVAEVVGCVCLGVVVAGVVIALKVVGGGASALVCVGVASKLESELESKSVLACVSHLDCLLLCWCWARTS